MRKCLYFLTLPWLLSCQTMVKVGATAAGAGIGAAVGGPAGAAAGAIAGWGTAEGIENAANQADFKERALEGGNWFLEWLEGLSLIGFVALLLFWFAPAPQDIVRHFKRKKRESQTT